MYYKKFNEQIISFSIITVPILTLIFGLRKSPFDYTLSMIGNWYDYYTRFVLWGIITSILLFISIYHIYQSANFKNRKAIRFLILSVIFLVLTVLTPTISEEPIQKELREIFVFNFHGLFGFAFSFFLILSLYLFSMYLSSVDEKLSLKSFRWLLITVGGSIITLFIFGMTGIFEIFFFVSLSIFLFIINIGIKKKLKKDKEKT